MNETASTTYAAFLRGINVGGNSLVKMADLKKAFEDMGFTNVRTILASGNVVFQVSKKEKVEMLAKKIEKKLEEKLGRKIGIQVRSIDELKKIVESEPFKKIKVTPDTRLYVTLYPEPPKKELKIPYSVTKNGNEFKILKITEGEIFSVLELSKNNRTPELMNVIEQYYGKNVTTRNWNTMLKVVK